MANMSCHLSLVGRTSENLRRPWEDLVDRVGEQINKWKYNIWITKPTKKPSGKCSSSKAFPIKKSYKGIK